MADQQTPPDVGSDLSSAFDAIRGMSGTAAPEGNTAPQEPAQITVPVADPGSLQSPSTNPSYYYGNFRNPNSIDPDTAFGLKAEEAKQVLKSTLQSNVLASADKQAILAALNNSPLNNSVLNQLGGNRQKLAEVIANSSEDIRFDMRRLAILADPSQALVDPSIKGLAILAGAKAGSVAGTAIAAINSIPALMGAAAPATTLFGLSLPATWPVAAATAVGAGLGYAASELADTPEVAQYTNIFDPPGEVSREYAAETAKMTVVKPFKGSETEIPDAGEVLPLKVWWKRMTDSANNEVIEKYAEPIVRALAAANSAPIEPEEIEGFADRLNSSKIMSEVVISPARMLANVPRSMLGIVGGYPALIAQAVKQTALGIGDAEAYALAASGIPAHILNESEISPEELAKVYGTKDLLTLFQEQSTGGVSNAAALAETAVGFVDQIKTSVGLNGYEQWADRMNEDPVGLATDLLMVGHMAPIALRTGRGAVDGIFDRPLLTKEEAVRSALSGEPGVNLFTSSAYVAGKLVHAAGAVAMGSGVAAYKLLEKKSRSAGEAARSITDQWNDIWSNREYRDMAAARLRREGFSYLDESGKKVDQPGLSDSEWDKLTPLQKVNFNEKALESTYPDYTRFKGEVNAKLLELEQMNQRQHELAREDLYVDLGGDIRDPITGSAATSEFWTPEGAADMAAHRALSQSMIDRANELNRLAEEKQRNKGQDDADLITRVENLANMFGFRSLFDESLKPTVDPTTGLYTGVSGGIRSLSGKIAKTAEKLRYVSGKMEKLKSISSSQAQFERFQVEADNAIATGKSVEFLSRKAADYRSREAKYRDRAEKLKEDLKAPAESLAALRKKAKEQREKGHEKAANRTDERAAVIEKLLGLREQVAPDGSSGVPPSGTGEKPSTSRSIDSLIAKANESKRLAEEYEAAAKDKSSADDFLKNKYASHTENSGYVGVEKDLRVPLSFRPGGRGKSVKFKSRAEALSYLQKHYGKHVSGLTGEMARHERAVAEHEATYGASLRTVGKIVVERVRRSLSDWREKEIKRIESSGSFGSKDAVVAEFADLHGSKFEETNAYLDSLERAIDETGIGGVGNQIGSLSVQQIMHDMSNSVDGFWPKNFDGSPASFREHFSTLRSFGIPVVVPLQMAESLNGVPRLPTLSSLLNRSSGPSAISGFEPESNLGKRANILSDYLNKRREYETSKFSGMEDFTDAHESLFTLAANFFGEGKETVARGLNAVAKLRAAKEGGASESEISSLKAEVKSATRLKSNGASRALSLKLWNHVDPVATSGVSDGGSHVREPKLRDPSDAKDSSEKIKIVRKNELELARYRRERLAEFDKFSENPIAYMTEAQARAALLHLYGEIEQLKNFDVDLLHSKQLAEQKNPDLRVLFPSARGRYTPIERASWMHDVGVFFRKHTSPLRALTRMGEVIITTADTIRGALADQFISPLIPIFDQSGPSSIPAAWAKRDAKGRVVARLNAEGKPVGIELNGHMTIEDAIERSRVDPEFKKKWYDPEMAYTLALLTGDITERAFGEAAMRGGPRVLDNVLAIRRQLNLIFNAVRNSQIEAGITNTVQFRGDYLPQTIESLIAASKESEEAIAKALNHKVERSGTDELQEALDHINNVRGRVRNSRGYGKEIKAGFEMEREIHDAMIGAMDLGEIVHRYAKHAARVISVNRQMKAILAERNVIKENSSEAVLKIFDDRVRMLAGYNQHHNWADNFADHATRVIESASSLVFRGATGPAKAGSQLPSSAIGKGSLVGGAATLAAAGAVAGIAVSDSEDFAGVAKDALGSAAVGAVAGAALSQAKVGVAVRDRPFHAKMSHFRAISSLNRAKARGYLMGNVAAALQNLTDNLRTMHSLGVRNFFGAMETKDAKTQQAVINELANALSDRSISKQRREQLEDRLFKAQRDLWVIDKYGGSALRFSMKSWMNEVMDGQTSDILAQSNVVEPLYMFNTALDRSSPRWLDATLFAPFQLAEYVSRGMAFYTGMTEMLKDKNMVPEQAAAAGVEYAQKMGLKYGPLFTSPAYSNPAIALFSTFSKYTVKMAEFALDASVDAARSYYDLATEGWHKYSSVSEGKIEPNRFVESYKATRLFALAGFIYTASNPEDVWNNLLGIGNDSFLKPAYLGLVGAAAVRHKGGRTPAGEAILAEARSKTTAGLTDLEHHTARIEMTKRALGAAAGASAGAYLSYVAPNTKELDDKGDLAFNSYKETAGAVGGGLLGLLAGKEVAARGGASTKGRVGAGLAGLAVGASAGSTVGKFTRLEHGRDEEGRYVANLFVQVPETPKGSADSYDLVRTYDGRFLSKAVADLHGIEGEKVKLSPEWRHPFASLPHSYRMALSEWTLQRDVSNFTFRSAPAGLDRYLNDGNPIGYVASLLGGPFAGWIADAVEGYLGNDEKAMLSRNRLVQGSVPASILKMAGVTSSNARTSESELKAASSWMDDSDPRTLADAKARYATFKSPLDLAGLYTNNFFSIPDAHSPDASERRRAFLFAMLPQFFYLNTPAAGVGRTLEAMVYQNTVDGRTRSGGLAAQNTVDAGSERAWWRNFATGIGLPSTTEAVEKLAASLQRSSFTNRKGLMTAYATDLAIAYQRGDNGKVSGIFNDISKWIGEGTFTASDLSEINRTAISRANLEGELIRLEMARSHPMELVEMMKSGAYPKLLTRDRGQLQINLSTTDVKALTNPDGSVKEGSDSESR